jgi:hypothetical protein
LSDITASVVNQQSNNFGCSPNSNRTKPPAKQQQPKSRLNAQPFQVNLSTKFAYVNTKPQGEVESNYMYASSLVSNVSNSSPNTNSDKHPGKDKNINKSRFNCQPFQVNLASQFAAVNTTTTSNLGANALGGCNQIDSVLTTSSNHPTNETSSSANLSKSKRKIAAIADEDPQLNQDSEPFSEDEELDSGEENYISK